MLITLKKLNIYVEKHPITTTLVTTTLHWCNSLFLNITFKDIIKLHVQNY